MIFAVFEFIILFVSCKYSFLYHLIHKLISLLKTFLTVTPLSLVVMSARANTFFRQHSITRVEFMHYIPTKPVNIPWHLLGKKEV